MGEHLEDLKAAGMYNPTGGPTYFERHGHRPDKPCGKFCPGNPAQPGGNGGGMAIGVGSMPDGATVTITFTGDGATFSGGANGGGGAWNNRALRPCCSTEPGSGHRKGCAETGG